MKAYLAAPIFNPAQLAVVTDINNSLVSNNFEVFSPYAASQQIWKGRAPKDCTPEERAAVLKGNIVNLEFPTELLVAWVGGTEDGRVDTGVCWEMGFFYNRTRMNHSPAHTLAYIDPADKRQAMNLMLAGTVQAVANGLAELQEALALYRLEGARSMAAAFHPDRHIQHEREPIV